MGGIAGLLAMIIIGGLILDHLWIVAGLAVLAVLFAVCYTNGKKHTHD